MKSFLLALVLLAGSAVCANATKVITIEFEGEVTGVVDNTDPYFGPLLPTGTTFEGTLAFQDTNNMWPNPGTYNNANASFNILFDKCVCYSNNTLSSTYYISLCNSGF